MPTPLLGWVSFLPLAPVRNILYAFPSARSPIATDAATPPFSILPPHDVVLLHGSFPRPAHSHPGKEARRPAEHWLRRYPALPENISGDSHGQPRHPFRSAPFRSRPRRRRHHVSFRPRLRSAGGRAPPLRPRQIRKFLRIHRNRSANSHRFLYRL